jgi:large-conductance mechanosensitive channel
MENIIKTLKYLFIDMYEGFLAFLLDRNILSVGIGLIIATQLSKISNSFIESIVSPIINKVIGSNTDTLKEYRIEIFGIKFEIGNLLINIINLIFIIFLIYFIWRFSFIFDKKIGEQKLEALKKGVKNEPVVIHVHSNNTNEHGNINNDVSK